MTLLTDQLPLLAGAPDGIKKLRELILELAVRGKLVPQDPNDEPASELLKRIVEEKARLVAEGKIKKAIAGESEIAEVSYPIPSTWVAAQLGQVVEIVRGITFPASEKSKLPESGRVACLRTSNVQNEIEWDDLLYIRENFVSRPDQYVQPHDIVMSMANSRELVGKVALIGPTLDQATTFGGFLGVIRPVLIEPEFVMALLRTPQARSALIDSASQTTNIANVSLAKLRPLPFAIPPLSEQCRIVAKVHELMALCDALESQQANAESTHAQLVQALLDSLTQANDAEDFAASWQRLSEHFDTLFTTEASIHVLKQTVLQLAVMGKLVPQDPSDEPASKLLRAIAAEKSRLVADGKVQPPRELAEPEDLKALYAVPSSWEWSRLGSQVIESGAGWSPSCEARPRAGDEWGVLKVSAVSWGKFQPDQNKALPASLEPRPEHEVVVGDFLVSRANTAELVARSIVVDRAPSRLMLSDKIVRLRLTKRCNSRYVNLVNSSSQARDYYSQVAGGTSSSMKNVSRGQILNLPIAIPPLAEQHRIVAKVDQLMSLCDQLKSCIRQARALNHKLASMLVERALA